MRYLYGGYSDVGYKRELNEDFMNVTELGNDCLFAVIADGAGSKASSLQPAAIATREVDNVIKRVYAKDKEALLKYPTLFMYEAMLSANQTIGAFKLGNEELFAGFASSLTCCLLYDNDKMAFAHTGNTRLYLIRVNPKDNIPNIRQLTVDQTKAHKMLNEGAITLEEYHTHPDRLIITGGLGVVSEPLIQTFEAKIKPLDFLLMTTDGIHYAIKPEPLAEIVIRSETCDNAVKALIEGAMSLKYNDNMSAIVLFNTENN